MSVDAQLKIAADRGRFLSPTFIVKKGLCLLSENVRLLTIRTTPNAVVRRIGGLEPVATEELREIHGIDVSRLVLNDEDHLLFLARFYPEWRDQFSHPFYKKLVELHASWRLLEFKENDTYLDLAGGCFTYAGRLEIRRQLLNDRFVNRYLRSQLAAQSVELVESPAEQLPLPDQSIDKISCHHSFEHFQGDADTMALREIQRVLRPGGKACIIPIFVGGGYFEIVDLPWVPQSDPEARRVFDPTSPFPGGRFSGGFARVYSVRALRDRALHAIDTSAFSISIVQIENSNTTLPDPSLPCHRTDPRIDFPYRALLIERKV